MTSFYNRNELEKLGFKKIGNNVLISKKSSIYNPENITIGNNVRIDDFCILSGEINIKNYVHISAFCALYGKFGIEIGNFSGISPRCTIFSASDDFSGNYMVGPMVPMKFTNPSKGKVIISDYVQIGTNSVIMPSVLIKNGAAIGAFSFVTKDIESWKICFGNPVKIYKDRNKKILNFAKKISKTNDE